MLGAVAHHHPVHLAARLAIRSLAQARHRPLLARFPNQLGIERQAAHLERIRIHLPDQVEIHETVVQRRHQRVGGGGNVAGKFIVAPGRVDNQEIHARAQRITQRVQFRHSSAAKHLEAGAGQAHLPLGGGFRAVFQIAVQRALARIQIDRRHLRPQMRQRDGHMHGGGGFARAALFIGKNDAVCWWERGLGRGGLRSHVRCHNWARMKNPMLLAGRHQG